WVAGADPFGQPAGPPGEEPARHPAADVARELERGRVIAELVIDLGESKRRVPATETTLGEGGPRRFEPAARGREVTLLADEAHDPTPEPPHAPSGRTTWLVQGQLERLDSSIPRLEHATVLVLASASPRRRELLGWLVAGWVIVVAEIDEQPAPEEAAGDLV